MVELTKLIQVGRVEPERIVVLPDLERCAVGISSTKVILMHMRISYGTITDLRRPRTPELGTASPNSGTCRLGFAFDECGGVPIPLRIVRAVPIVAQNKHIRRGLAPPSWEVAAPLGKC